MLEKIAKMIFPLVVIIGGSLLYGLGLYVGLALAYPSDHYYMPITNYEIYGMCFATALWFLGIGFLIGGYKSNRLK